MQQASPSERVTRNPTIVERTSDRELVVTRTFNAPAHIVFDAWTKPELVMRWWAPRSSGMKLLACEIDLRVGGAWRFVNRHPKGEAAFYGEYREITPPSRLVFTEIYEQFPDSVSVVTAGFTDEGGKTRLTATVRYPSLEVRDMVLASGMARGAGISYDRLEDLVAELQRS